MEQKSEAGTHAPVEMEIGRMKKRDCCCREEEKEKECVESET